jgi:hypothetical protein
MRDGTLGRTGLVKQYKAREEKSSPSFFVTFDAFGEKWKGHLTVGKHCYYYAGKKDSQNTSPTRQRGTFSLEPSLARRASVIILPASVILVEHQCG